MPAAEGINSEINWLKVRLAPFLYSPTSHYLVIMGTVVTLGQESPRWSLVYEKETVGCRGVLLQSVVALGLCRVSSTLWALPSSVLGHECPLFCHDLLQQNDLFIFLPKVGIAILRLRPKALNA